MLQERAGNEDLRGGVGPVSVEPDDFAADVRETIRTGGQGTPFEKASDAAMRRMLLVDRESNRGANLILCETEDDLRRVDAAMNEITPAAGRGARTGGDVRGNAG